MKSKNPTDMKPIKAIITILLTAFALLAVLKLCGATSLSWWWVAAPLWIPLALALLSLIYIVSYIITHEAKPLPPEEDEQQPQ